MIAVLILNADCSISALCEVEHYQYFQYQEQGCAVLQVEMNQEVFDLIKKTMWDLHQNVYVLISSSQEKLLPKDATYFVCYLPCEGVPVLALPF